MMRSNKKVFENILKLAKENITYDILTKNNFWSLPDRCKLGGYGVDWNNCIYLLQQIAFSIKNYHDLERSIMTLSNIYIVLRYGNSRYKESLISQLQVGTSDASLERFIVNLSSIKKVEHLNFSRLILMLLASDVAIDIAKTSHHSDCIQNEINSARMNIDIGLHNISDLIKKVTSFSKYK